MYFVLLQIWIEPEDSRQLTPIFSKLRDAHLYNIFAECDLNWTMFILEGAPSLENFYVSPLLQFLQLTHILAWI